MPNENIISRMSNCRKRLFFFIAQAAAVWLSHSSFGAEKNAETSEVQVSGEETFFAEAIGDNGDINENLYGDDDNFSRYVNSLFIKAQSPIFDSELRLDTTFFYRSPRRANSPDFVPDGSKYTLLNFYNDYRLEHLHGRVRLDRLTVTLGDFHISFGRGMVLSLLKLDDLGEDNRLRGARIDYRVQRKFSVTLAGGVVNTLNTDPLVRQIYRDDPMDRVFGARVEWELLDALAITSHFVVMKPRFTDASQISEDRLHVDRGPGVEVFSGGGSVELHAEGVHLYFEGNGQSHTDYRTSDTETTSESGAALFAEVSYDLSDFAVTAEGIFYRKWLMESAYRGAGNIASTAPVAYNNLATLEMDFIPIKSAGNAAGGRLSLSYFVHALNLDLKLRCPFIRYFGGLLPGGGWSDRPPTFIAHPVLEAKTRLGSRQTVLRIEGGGRAEHTSKPDIPGVDTGHLWHVSADATIPLNGPHSLKIEGEVRRHALDITEGNEYYVAALSLGYALSERLDATLGYEYSDELTKKNHIGDVQWLATHHFAWLKTSLSIPEIKNGLSIHLFAGSERGDIKCVGGVCRKYPDTVGVRLDLSLRF